MRQRYSILGAIICLFALTTGVRSDDFALAKKDLRNAGCANLEFLSLLESSVFDMTDTVVGVAHIASDGRYFVELGSDWYLFDGKRLHSYSLENNQLVIETVADEQASSSEIRFVTDLDRYYLSHKTSDSRRFQLTRRPTSPESLPDSMNITLATDIPLIRELSFYDVNDELNRIIILHQNLSDSCAQSIFEPAIPPDADVVKL